MAIERYQLHLYGRRYMRNNYDYSVYLMLYMYSYLLAYFDILIKLYVDDCELKKGCKCCILFSLGSELAHC